MPRGTDSLRDVTGPAGGAVSTGLLNVSQCGQVTVWFIASGAAAPTNCTVSLCDASGAQIVSVPVTVAIGGSSPAFAGEGPGPGVANAVALGPVPPMMFASGSGGAASTLRILVVGLPRATFQPLDSPTPIVPEDANSVAHVWWKDGTGLIDTKGNSWTMNGTVPQVARTVTAPGGAGPFSDTNYYSLGTGSDVLDFAGDFSACLVFGLPTLPNGPMPFSNGTYQVDGYFAQVTAAGVLAHGSGVAAQVSALTVNAVVAGVNVGCIGRSGGTISAKLNLGTMASVATGVPSPATTTPARLGRYTSAGLGFGGNIYEAWFSTTTPSDALFTSIMQIVKSRLRITAW